MEWWRKRHRAPSFDTCADCGKPIYGQSWGFIAKLEREWRRGMPVEAVHVRCYRRAALAAEAAASGGT